MRILLILGSLNKGGLLADGVCLECHRGLCVRVPTFMLLSLYSERGHAKA